MPDLLFFFLSMSTHLVLDIILLQLEYFGDNLLVPCPSFLLTITESLISSKHRCVTPSPKNVMALNVLRKKYISFTKISRFIWSIIYF